MEQMGVAGQGNDWHPWDAVVASDATLSAAESLGARFHQVVSPRGAARTRGWRVVAVVQAVTDVARAAWLAGDPGFKLWPRLATDLADLALWCAAAEDDWDSSEDAVVPGVALAAGAAARYGAAGAVVPVANAVVGAAVRAARGHRLRLEQFSWQAMGTIGGWCLRGLAQRRRALMDRRWAAEREAQLQRAEVAGFHDLIVEHEGAVDLLQRAAVLIDLGSPGAEVRSFMGAVKAAAAEAARNRASYLGDALAAWQRAHNLRPELAGMVHLDLAAGAGTVLLSSSQVAALHAGLDAAGLVGTVPIDIARDASMDRPFAARRLFLGTRVLNLPGEGDTRRWIFDATPVAFLMDLGWLAQPTGSHREAVPWAATIGPMAGALGAALWSARREETNRSVSPLAAVAISGAITLAYTVSATRTMRYSHTDAGISRFPWVMAIQGYELVRRISAEESGALVRGFGLVGTAAIMAIGWHLSPNPRSARALVAEFGWVVAFNAYARRLRRAMVESGTQLGAIVAAENESLEAEAYARGRQRAIRVIDEALDTARSDLERRGAELEWDVRAEAGRRLEEVAAALAGYSALPG